MAFVISGSFIISYFYDSYQNNKEYKNYKNISTEELLNINQDYYGWLHIDDVVNLPVVNTSDEFYYLNHSFSKQENKYGCLFTNIMTGSNNFIIHGHNNNNNSMFSLLVKYKDKDFFESHRTITFTTKDDEIKTYEIFAVINFNIETADLFNPYKYYLSSSIINQINENNIYDAAISISSDDSFIMLSTCDTDFYGSDGRLLIVGVECA